MLGKNASDADAVRALHEARRQISELREELRTSDTKARVLQSENDELRIELTELQHNTRAAAAARAFEDMPQMEPEPPTPRSARAMMPPPPPASSAAASAARGSATGARAGASPSAGAAGGRTRDRDGDELLSPEARARYVSRHDADYEHDQKHAAGDGVAESFFGAYLSMGAGCAGPGPCFEASDSAAANPNEMHDEIQGQAVR